MRAPLPSRRIVPLLAAVAGVVIAHAVDYLVVFPNGGARAGHLQATGHAYWPVALGAAAGAGALALIAVAAVGARPGAVRPNLKLGWLLAFQTGAFVAMEAGERVLVGLPPTVLLHSAELWFGLALQLPVAWLARHVLGAVGEVAHRIAEHRGRRSPRPSPRPAWRPAHGAGPFAVALESRARPRAPPRGLASI